MNKVRTEIGMVFQQFNLYPHMTVAANIKLAPVKVKNVSRERADERARVSSSRVGIPEQANKVSGEASRGASSSACHSAGAGDGAQDHALRRADELH
jgi:ABC-type polar amino acid transport system ATPase subunit